LFWSRSSSPLSSLARTPAPPWSSPWCPWS
jgi:hypothetical protein